MSDELATALRELAEANQAPPPLPAAEVRTRARRRSRRRRTTVRLGLATSAASMLATIGLTVHAEEPGRDPRASAGSATIGTPTSSPRAPEAVTARPADTEEAVLDLGRHTLTFDGRVMRVDSHFFGTFLSPGRELTVRAKHEVMLLRGEKRTENRHEAKVPYVVELRTGDRPPVYAGALAFDTRSLGALDVRTGWLGLSVNDARWFYTHVQRGEHVEITSTATPPPPAPTPVPGDGPDPGPETGTATSRPAG
ncbi:hypothetical protein OHB56_28650 [Streptomyces sp. NBC_01635]|uniref:hypothetical protein n=1 Tax=Streptomyces sp. NBC_01635 TaxID=2975904 RepID=UPI003864D2BD|nr:hypothetical protein OHB56_28650 [Streptomyces sp. NBC_01635]